jgi:hypothetical protein
LPPAEPTVVVPYDRLAAAAARWLVDEPPEIAEASGNACAWLEACSYPGVEILLEAVEATPADERHPPLEPDILGLDLRDISCVFQAPRVAQMVRQHGRLFLRNVRHGLYLVPFSVNIGFGIGCPVDPSFAIGGERTKDPYAEKIAAAKAAGIAVAEAPWRRLERGRSLT